MKREYNIFYCGQGIWKSAKSKAWMEKAGSDPHGIRIMMEKDQIYPIFVTNIYFGAGNILKQDLLSLGGDVVVHKFFVNGKKEDGSILLLGTKKHYRLLQTKMYAQHWGLKELAGDLKIIMENILTYREAEKIAFSEKEITIENRKELEKDFQIEDFMAKLPINKAKKEGFIPIKLENIINQDLLSQIYYPAISRGYYIENGKNKGEKE